MTQFQDLEHLISNESASNICGEACFPPLTNPKCLCDGYLDSDRNL